MENLKHTTGEWNFSKTVNDYEIHADGQSIALVYKDSRSIEKDEAEANAKLIHAAPDLLEACQTMLDAPGTGETNGNTPQAKAQRQSAYDKIYAAVQKAIYVLCFAFFLSSCSTSYHPVKEKGKKFIGHKGVRCSAATAKNTWKYSPKN